MVSHTPGRNSAAMEQKLHRSLERYDEQLYPLLRRSVPRMVSLVRQAPDRSTFERAEQIRHLVNESCQPVGDGALDMIGPDTVDRMMPYLLKRLDRLRRAAIRRGVLSDQPATSSWFG